jgi:GYF domain 2
MANRYYYIDRDGRVQGPVWLSIMRNRWKDGRLMMSTEISLTGTDGWQRMEFHPEIFEPEARLPAVKPKPPAKSNPVRLLVWTVLLFLAYLTWVAVHWDDGMRLQFDTDPPPAAKSR